MSRKRVGIGMLGAGWMGRVHSNGYKTAQYMFWPKSNWMIDLVGVGGIDIEEGQNFAARFGYKYGCAGYKELIEDQQIDIFDNVTPDRHHVEPTIAAARAGKNVICEKPMAVGKKDAKRMLDAVNQAGVKNLCCFSYRFMPAVRLAYELIKSGALGTIYHFGGKYYQDQGSKPETPVEDVWYIIGSGVAHGIASHMLDMSRFLVGEITSVMGMNKTYVKERPSQKGKVKVDATEGFFALLEYENGCTGVMQSLGVGHGKQSEFYFEIFGSKGSLCWNMDDPNILHVYLAETANEKVKGYTKVCATEPNHPFMDIWWPRGHVLGWEHGHINMIAHFVDCVANDKDVVPYGGTFEDGYKVAVLIDTINESAAKGKKLPVVY